MVVAALRENREHALTIGIHGDWSAEKSSVLRCSMRHARRQEGRVREVQQLDVSGIRRPENSPDRGDRQQTHNACDVFCWAADGRRASVVVKEVPDNRLALWSSSSVMR